MIANFYPFRRLHIAMAICLVSVSMLLTSCGNTRQLIYMQGKFDTAQLSQLHPANPLIQKGDLMSIVVYSDNPLATALFNQSVVAFPNGNSNSSGGNSTFGASSGTGVSPTMITPLTSPGYLVDDEGNIQFQGLGLLHIEGLTKGQLKELLNSKLDSKKGGELNNPYYTIRFLNYRFTMLGEVTRPGIFSIPGERISLLEAIGLAGDLTFYGRRDNILVIREKDGKRQFGRLDLTKPEIMASPYFYLQQNDVVIVEQNTKKAVANDQVTVRNITIATSIVTALGILYSIFRK